MAPDIFWEIILEVIVGPPPAVILRSPALARRLEGRPHTRPRPSIETRPRGRSSGWRHWLLHKRAVLIGRAEIHIDAADALAGEAKELGVAKTLSVFGHHLVGHERL